MNILSNINQASRLDILDVLRGVAIVLMIIFHFCFLLKELKIAIENFHSSDFLEYSRTLIVVLFLSVVGMSLKVSYLKGILWQRHFKRLLQIIIYAMAITVVTYLYNPERVVMIGILQFIAMATLAGLLLVRLKWFNLFIGIAIVLLGLNFESAVFNNGWLHWIGFRTHRPYTLGYAPIFPWFGVVVIGLFLGELLFKSRHLSHLKKMAQC